MLAFTLVFLMGILRDKPAGLYLKSRLGAERWFHLCYSPKCSFQILHAMGKIPEDEIWQSERESVVGYILFHEFKSLFSENNYLQKKPLTMFTYLWLSDSTHACLKRYHEGAPGWLGR